MARERVGRTTTVGVSKLRVGKPVGSGVRMGVGEPSDIANGVGVDVQLFTTMLSAPLDVAVAEDDCSSDGAKALNNKLNIKTTISDPQTTRNILALSLCLENHIANFLMVFMFFRFHLKLEMQTNKIILYESILPASPVKLEKRKPAPSRKKDTGTLWGERGSNPHVVTNDRF